MPWNKSEKIPVLPKKVKKTAFRKGEISARMIREAEAATGKSPPGKFGKAFEILLAPPNTRRKRNRF